MNEASAQHWFDQRYGASKLELLRAFAHLLLDANCTQNLIAPSTIPSLWVRHFVDSAQLIQFAPTDWDHWVDVGSGAGLPGIVIAILTDRSVTMIEPRRLRADFLRYCRDALSLPNISIVQARAEAEKTDVSPADVVSARAVANLTRLLSISQRFATAATTFVLPKGQSAQSEVAEATLSWHGAFHVEQSIVDPSSGVVVATGVAPR